MLPTYQHFVFAISNLVI